MKLCLVFSSVKPRGTAGTGGRRRQEGIFNHLLVENGDISIPISQGCMAARRTETGAACGCISSCHFQDTVTLTVLKQFLSINTSDFTALLF